MSSSPRNPRQLKNDVFVAFHVFTQRDGVEGAHHVDRDINAKLFGVGHVSSLHRVKGKPPLEISLLKDQQAVAVQPGADAGFVDLLATVSSGHACVPEFGDGEGYGGDLHLGAHCFNDDLGGFIVDAGEVFEAPGEWPRNSSQASDACALKIATTRVRAESINGDGTACKFTRQHNKAEGWRAAISNLDNAVRKFQQVNTGTAVFPKMGEPPEQWPLWSARFVGHDSGCRSVTGENVQDTIKASVVSLELSASDALNMQLALVGDAPTCHPVANRALGDACSGCREGLVSVVVSKFFWAHGDIMALAIWLSP